MPTLTQSLTRSYDFIGFGDEVPGLLALVSAAREYRRQVGSYPRSLVMFKGSSAEGIGGHLVRGKLAYLDRSSVPWQIRQVLALPTFGDAPAIYKEFLQRAGVAQIALDPRKADAALRQMLSEAGIDVLSKVEIETVLKQGQEIAGIQLTSGETYLGKQFIDSTVNAELAQAAGVQKLKGFETLGLPKSELAISLIFETEGLSISALRTVEAAYLKRFNNPADTVAQSYINSAADFDPAVAQYLRDDVTQRDESGQVRTMWVGEDYIDIPTKALSIAYHSFRGKKFSLKENGFILDNANIAILPGGRLCWNALLFHATADQAEALARAAAKPTSAMLEEIPYLERWFKSLGATALKPASELYIRHAGNITGVVQAFSGAQMLAGGVPNSEALGTFGYHFDARGGIDGLTDRATAKGLSKTAFNRPLLNIGIQHTLIQEVPNLAVVSPASGFTGYGCTAGRIVEFNVGVGQAVGIAASLALRSGRNLADISNREVKQVLSTTGKLPKIYGKWDAMLTELDEFEKRLALPPFDAGEDSTQPIPIKPAKPGVIEPKPSKAGRILIPDLQIPSPEPVKPQKNQANL
jgi:hypothetical protein